MTTRTCTKCKTTKAFDQFHKNSRTKSGRSFQCADCRNAANSIRMAEQAISMETDPTWPICSYAGCERKTRRRSGKLRTCDTHYSHYRKNRTAQNITDVCTIDACERVTYARQMCPMHYQRYKIHGDPTFTLQPNRGKGRYVNDQGYYELYRPNDPRSGSLGYILEHRLVMSDTLGRPLLSEETVHHINGVRTDNRIENLELWSSKHPKGQRVDDKIAWAIEMLETYRPEALA